VRFKHFGLVAVFADKSRIYQQEVTMKNSAAALALVIAIGSMAPAWAQDKADFAALQTTLKREDKVTLTTLAGDKIEGRMVGVSVGQIELLTKNGPRTVDAVQIQKVQKRKNGVALGAVVGTAAGITSAVALAKYVGDEGGVSGGLPSFRSGWGWALESASMLQSAPTRLCTNAIRVGPLRLRR